MKITAQAHRAIGAMAGALVLAAGLGVTPAAAGPYRHHHPIASQDFSAYVFAAPGRSIGTWRFNTFRGGGGGGCDRAYPMHESYPCGSPTGGPVGGMGS